MTYRAMPWVVVLVVSMVYRVSVLRTKMNKYLLPDICLLTGVLWCNLPTDAPYRGAPCRPVPSPKPRPEALVTRYRKLAFPHFISLFSLLRSMRRCDR